MAWVESKKLAKEKTSYFIVYELPQGCKRKIFGFTNKNEAGAFCRNLNVLLTARKVGRELPLSLIEWINGLSDDVHAKLSADGFLEPRASVGTLEDLTRYFLNGDEAQEHKESTIRSRRTMARRWLSFWGKHRSVADFTFEDAKQYRAFHAQTYSEATWGREVKSLKQIFNFAVEELHWIKENPFRKLKGGKQANRKKLHEVTAEESAAILEECPSAEMRLVFCLARFGALRIPSELKTMEWNDVNFDRGTLTVNIPKKTHKRDEASGNYETRVIPLFPELRHAFTEYFETLPDGASSLVFPNCPTGQALTSRFRKILKRAGVPMWEKFFVNMRSTRDTELRRRFPEHLVNQWVGHTQAVAEAHYIQNSQQDIEAAANFRTADFEISGGETGTRAADSTPQNAEAFPHFSRGKLRGETKGAQSFYDSFKQISEVKKSPEKTRRNQEIKKGVATLQPLGLTSMGLEPMPRP